MEKDELRKLQKEEVIKRLQILERVFKVHNNVLKEYQVDGTVYYSERQNQVFDGILYWLENNSDFVDAVKEIEDKYNILVYHCILNHTEFGDWLSMLFVSDNPENWVEERNSLITGIVKTFVYDFGNFESDFGDIEIAGKNGGLARVN